MPATTATPSDPADQERNEPGPGLGSHFHDHAGRVGSWLGKQGQPDQAEQREGEQFTPRAGAGEEAEHRQQVLWPGRGGPRGARVQSLEHEHR